MAMLHRLVWENSGKEGNCRVIIGELGVIIGELGGNYRRTVTNSGGGRGEDGNLTLKYRYFIRHVKKSTQGNFRER